MDKKLVVIYNASAADQEIMKSDYEQFFLPLKSNQKFVNAGINIDPWYCPSSQFLFDKLDTLLKEGLSPYRFQNKLLMKVLM